MGKFVIEKWSCDRCGCVADKWLRPSAAYHVHVAVAYDTAGGTEIDWREMCVECSRQVGAEVEALKKSAGQARAAMLAALKDTTHVE